MGLSNAERQKRYRQKRNGVTSNGAGVTAVTGVTQVEEPATPVVRACANCQSLAEEVARLKKLLATANDEIVRLTATRIAVVTPRTTIDARGVEMAGGVGKAAVASPAWTGKAGLGGIQHGLLCACRPCKDRKAGL